MNGTPSDTLTISQLIELLQDAKKQHGDVKVIHGGQDYPEGVRGLNYIPRDKGDGYVPGNSIWIR